MDSGATDLLIFKLRGKEKGIVENREEKKNQTQNVTNVSTEHGGIGGNAEKEANVASNMLGFEKENRVLVPIKMERVDSGKSSIYDSNRADGTQKKYPADEKGMTKDESRNFAKSLRCLVHPWRQAYAVCNYCKMGFCYADIVEHDEGYYCIEDSGKVATREPVRVKVQANVILKISAALFLCIFIILFVSTYQQAAFVAANLGGNILQSLPTLPHTYAISLLNLVLAVLAFLDAIIIVAFTARSIEISETIGAIIILAMSYEYMISSVPYLIGIAVFAVGALVGVLISKVIENTVVFVQETESTSINWPRLETFG